MEELYTVSFAKVIDQFHLETIYLPTLPEDIQITCARVNRPGLQMVGFYDHFEQSRIQIIGKVENLFISQMEPEEKRRRLEDFFRSAPVGVIVTSCARRCAFQMRIFKCAYVARIRNTFL